MLSRIYRRRWCYTLIFVIFFKVMRTVDTDFGNFLLRPELNHSVQKRLAFPGLSSKCHHHLSSWAIPSLARHYYPSPHRRERQAQGYGLVCYWKCLATNSLSSSRIFVKFSMRSYLLISLIGTSSLKAIFRDLLGMDFFELCPEVFPAQSVAPRYSIISGRAVRAASAWLALLVDHFNSDPWLLNWLAEFSLMDLMERYNLR